MDEHTRYLSLYASYAYTPAYFAASPEEQRAFRKQVAEQAATAAESTFFYSVFPTRSDADFLIWSSWHGEDTKVPGAAFTKYAEVVEGWRKFVTPVQTLWGLTRVSQYARGKSEQDMDPMDENRELYFVAYPFSKTKEWYLMSKDARQGQMNEHIKLGKQFPEIKQLLLYSFGLQDHEFVVAYEMGDLGQFSQLVNDLRSTEARRYTALDTPLITGILRSREEFVR